MRRRMAAKIAPMKMPPQRIALVALLLLTVVGGGVWWWQARPSAPQPLASEARQAPIATSPAPSSTRNVAARAPREKPDPVFMALMEQCSDSLTVVFRERNQQLSNRQDAASQLAYALTSPMAQDDGPATEEDIERRMAQQLELQQRAFAHARSLDPKHPDIAWLAAEKCFDQSKCVEVQQALLQAEPANAAAWLRAMTWARSRKDDAAVEEAFKRAAAASRYDTHRGSASLAVMEGYAGLQTPPACMDSRLQDRLRKEMPAGRVLDASLFVEMMALAGEHASPFVGSELSTHCTAEDGGALSAGRQAGCVRIYTGMAGSDSALEQMIATRQLIGMLRDAPEGPVLRERYRGLQWLFEEQRRDWKQFGMDSDGVEAMQETLAKAGRWPPPADWLPKDERARSLILTGRPPPEKKPK